MKWLHYSLLCRCHSSSAVASPPHWEAFSKQPLLCHARRWQNQIDIFILLFCSCIQNDCGVTVFTPLLLVPMCSSSSLPNIFLHLQRQMKPKRGLLCSRCQIHFQTWTGLTVELCHDCPKQSNRGRGERRLKWGWTLNIISIIITLKDLHWQRDESQEGLPVISVQRAPSVDHPVGGKKKQGITSKQMRMSVHAKSLVMISAPLLIECPRTQSCLCFDSIQKEGKRKITVNRITLLSSLTHLISCWDPVIVPIVASSRTLVDLR